uniref:Uncharacterized protein n=1 Tax=Rhizophora mucronata TaxID=61149 RepID=A0A2P2PKR5_RHIMU
MHTSKCYATKISHEVQNGNECLTKFV